MEKLLEYDEVLEAHLISGKYYVLAVLEFWVYGHSIFTSPQKIIMNFVEKVRSLKHVLDTETVLPLRSASPEAPPLVTMFISMIPTEALDWANRGITFAHMRNCYKIQCARLSYGRIVDGRSFKFLEEDPDRFCSAEEGFMCCCRRFQRATG